MSLGVPFIESNIQLFLCSVLVSLHSVRSVYQERANSVRSVCQGRANSGPQFVVPIKVL